MTKQELLDALRAATGPCRELDAEIWLAFTPGATRQKRIVVSSTGAWAPYEIDETRDAERRLVTVPSYTASLDAAVAFCERMLPRWGVLVRAAFWDDTSAHLTQNDGDCRLIRESCATACLSLCAAVLAALIAQETQYDQ